MKDDSICAVYKWQSSVDAFPQKAVGTLYFPILQRLNISHSS